MKKRLLFVVPILVILAVIIFAATHNKTPAPHTTNTASNTTAQSSTKPAGFNKTRYSTTDPSSIWVVVNKQHPLNPKTYAPDLVVPNITLRSNITGDERQVSKQMAPALESMAAGAKADGLTLTLESGYRSYNFQVNLYNSYVHSMGQATADTQSARPGYSEHQTGLASDLGGTTTPNCNVEQCFGGTPEGKWLAAHAYEYGFVIRYTTAKQDVTGYENEPWHVRYVGKDLAGEMHRTGIQTLEEFFGVSGGEAY